MLTRKAYKELEQWYTHEVDRALLVTGARQVGKTFLIHEFLKDKFANVVTIDFVEQPDALAAFNNAHNADEIFMAISLYAGKSLVPHETVIFIDEVQKNHETLTAIKYLLQRKEYRFVLSGSLLGVELRNVRSLPVGSVHVVDMYPLDFEEFCWAHGISRDILSEVERAFHERTPVPTIIHERLINLFHHYLIVGGMPAAVAQFVSTSDLGHTASIQNDILRLYRYDISQYAPQKNQLVIKEIFDEIPSQLDSQSKRFTFSALSPRGTYERYRHEFVWLIDAGVALPTTNVSEPRHPLKLAEGRSHFKLFMLDVGLLSAASGMEVMKSILSDKLGVNYGSIFENAVAQELHTHGHSLHYFRSNKTGEVDFIIENGNGKVLPIEVKSGKTYKRHSALTNLLNTENYAIDEAIVLCEANTNTNGKITYYPIYMSMFV